MPLRFVASEFLDKALLGFLGIGLLPFHELFSYFDRTNVQVSCCSPFYHIHHPFPTCHQTCSRKLIFSSLSQIVFWLALLKWFPLFLRAVLFAAVLSFTHRGISASGIDDFEAGAFFIVFSMCIEKSTGYPISPVRGHQICLLYQIRMHSAAPT